MLKTYDTISVTHLQVRLSVSSQSFTFFLYGEAISLCMITEDKYQRNVYRFNLKEVKCSCDEIQNLNMKLAWFADVFEILHF